MKEGKKSTKGKVLGEWGLKGSKLESSFEGRLVPLRSKLALKSQEKEGLDSRSGLGKVSRKEKGSR